jgi:hypothetical protein
MYSGLNGNEEGKEGISSEIGSKKLLACLNVFANKDNFPVYVHCVLGRDRTGTVVGVLLALCGVSKEEIVYDYELSFFSRIGRDPETDVLKQLGSFYDTLDYLCSFDGSSLRECTENYLLSIGMKRETMELIKRNLVE